MIAASALLALAIVAPKDGVTVPTLSDGQKGYLSSARAVRLIRLDNPADRAKLFALGGVQVPVRLAWSGETNATYLVRVAREGAAAQSFAVSNRTDVYVTNLELGSRFDWAVREAGTTNEIAASFRTEETAPRLLRAGGVGNFRDLGGWKTADGRRVRENRIFRSAGLRFSSKSHGGFFQRKVELGKRRITEAGIATLQNDFKIRTDLELRTPQETMGMNDSTLGPDVQWRSIPFVAYEFIDNTIRGREPFAKIFSLFTDEKNYPILMHCSGGRDRTGTLAFLLNGLLGVPEEDLCRDWELSIFSDTGMKFNSSRLRALLDYLKTLPGETVNARIESYARGCGITDAEIAAFRSLMLE